MERARRTGTKKQSREAVRAALRAAREGAPQDPTSGKRQSGYSRTSNRTGVRRPVRRRQNEDFVVDDDGLGGSTTTDTAATTKAWRSCSAAAMGGGPRAVEGRRPESSKLKEARADGEERQTTKSRTQFLGGDARRRSTARHVVAKQLDAFESLIDGPACD